MSVCVCVSSHVACMDKFISLATSSRHPHQRSHNSTIDDGASVAHFFYILSVCVLRCSVYCTEHMLYATAALPRMKFFLPMHIQLCKYRHAEPLDDANSEGHTAFMCVCYWVREFPVAHSD